MTRHQLIGHMKRAKKSHETWRKMLLHPSTKLVRARVFGTPAFHARWVRIYDEVIRALGR